MQRNRLEWFIGTRRRRDATIILLWTLSIAAVFLQAIYQRASPSVLDDAIVLVICIVAGAALMELGRAILGYFLAIPLGMALVFFLTTLPALDGTIGPPGDQLLITLWLSIIIKMIFPVQFLVFLFGSVIGSIIGEYYL